MTGDTIIRVSALSGYADCPRRSAARLFRREIEAAGYRLRTTLRGIGSAIGTAVHRAAAVGFAEKARDGVLPPASVATDVAMASLREATDGEILFDGPNGTSHNRGEAEKQTERMTLAYWEHVAPGVDAILSETRLEAEVAPGVVLSGQPDLVCREPNAVRDLKTGARIGTHAPQLGGYSLLARTHNIAIEHASIDWVARVKTRKPQPEPQSVAVAIGPAETAAQAMIGHIVSNLNSFRHGDAARRMAPGDPWSFPANPASMLCSPKYCPAFGTEFCREGREGK